MVLKQADDRAHEIAELNALLKQPGLTETQKTRLQDEIHNLEKGAWGEQQAAYYLDFHFTRYKGTIILHDLRFELDNGQSAQIDHLVITRSLDVYILESKNWNQLTVDETGACTIWKGWVVGVPSPLEQAKRHAAVLKRVFEIHPVLQKLVSRPDILCRVLLAPGCHLKAPHHKEWYVKADAFHTIWEKEMENVEFTVKNVISLTRAVSRTVSRENLEKIGHALIESHNPVRRDWRAKFGISLIETIPMNEVVARIEGLQNSVPKWGADWFVLQGKPTEETKKAIKAAGYRAQQENGVWVWRLKS